MQRVLAAVVAMVMLSTLGSAVWHHVHAYVDHDHPDHHHGPALHGHAAVGHAHAPDAQAADALAPDSPTQDGPQLHGCDPGDHAVSAVFTYVAPPHAEHVVGPVTLETILVAPLEQAGRHVTPSDVRAHSPPRLTDAPLRAPPVVHLA